MGRQTCLEKKAIERRQIELVRNDHNANDQYSETHPDALSDGDAYGKGNGRGGHLHSVPDCTKPSTMFDYSNFDTHSENIGGLYDIEGRNGIGGRNYLKNISVYNEENQYGVDYVDMGQNIADGQIVINEALRVIQNHRHF